MFELGEILSVILEHPEGASDAVSDKREGRVFAGRLTSIGGGIVNVS